MSKENQIDKQSVGEMAKVVKSSLDGLGCGNFNFTGDEISTMFSKALYNAGYRRQTENTVEVVRCKDCVWWEAESYGSVVGKCENPINGLAGEYVDDSDFCSYGRQKKGGE